LNADHPYNEVPFARRSTSFDKAPDLANAPDSIKIAYAKGVPMGGDLKRSARAPTSLFTAMKDPKGGSRPVADRQGRARCSGKAA
jgi:hypothetical protein